MKTHDYQTLADTNKIVSAAKILKNHRQLQNDISKNIQHWLSIINFNAQSIVSKIHDDSADFSSTEKLAIEILDACGDLENFQKCLFRNN